MRKTSWLLAPLVALLAPLSTAETQPPWRRLASPPCGAPITALAIDPLSPAFIYAGSCGVFKLVIAESGEWPSIPIFPDPVYTIAIASTTPSSTIYLISLSAP
jgi:hypothetical protein